MPKPKYTLEALEKLRDAQVDEAKKQLAERIREREGATARRQSAERTAEARRVEAERIREGERRSLETVGMSVHDLVLANAWELGVQTEAERLHAEVERRKQEEHDASLKEAEARAGVALKKADTEVVKEDHERFDARVRKAEQAKEEEAAEEAWRPKH